MFAGYVRFVFRQFARHKAHYLLILTGLATGITCSTLIFLYVEHEWSYDRSNVQGDRIFRAMIERTAPGRVTVNDVTPPPLGPALQNEFPEIEQAVRILNIDNPVPLLGRGDKKFYEEHFLFGDRTVFKVFTLRFIQGDPSSALQGPNEVVLTRETALKYFGNENALGQTITLNNNIPLVVRGIVDPMPSNSTLQFDLLASFPTLEGWVGQSFLESWQNNTCQTFLLLRKPADANAMSQRLEGFLNARLARDGIDRRVILQPLYRIHLFAFNDFGMASAGDIDDVYLLAAMGLIVLLIAAANFINLTTVRMTIRAKEVGVRKILGASRKRLLLQFMFESALLTALALSAAALLVELALPLADEFSGKDLSGFSAQHWEAWLIPIGLALAVGLFSGSYPAFYLSSLNPTQSLKGLLAAGRSRTAVRKSLVIFQFTLTIVLLVGTGVVRKQLDFLDKRELGFVKENILVIPIRDEKLRQNCEPLKARLRLQSGVLATGAAALLPGGPVGRTQFLAEGMHDRGMMSMLWVDHDFVKTLGMTMLAGRDFSTRFPADISSSFILNERAVQLIGWSTPADAIGKSFELVGGKKGTIIGVVKNFNVTSLRRSIDPLVLHLWPWLNYILVKVEPTAYPGILESLKQTWQDVDPEHPFTYTFLSEKFDRFLQPDRRMNRVFGSFSILAIVIACSGLFSLIALTTQQRTKEVGIRKVLGADATTIWGMLTHETVLLVLLANLFAWPIAYALAKSWLRNFAYPVELDIGVFALSGAIALVVATMTVGYHSARAAMANPVTALRYE